MPITYDIDGPIAIITIDRPERRNASRRGHRPLTPAAPPATEGYRRAVRSIVEIRMSRPC